MLYQLLYLLHYSDPIHAPWPIAGLMLGAAGYLAFHMFRIITR